MSAPGIHQISSIVSTVKIGPMKNKPSKPPFEELTKDSGKPPRGIGIGARIRNYFLTGLVVAAPLSITIYITWSFINFVDDSIKPWLPELYNPDTYLPFAVPGVGLLFALVGLTLIGALTANLFGRSLIQLGEQILGRTPVVRNLYRALKQIFETVISQSSNSFQEVGLIEYPRTGLYAIVFVSTDTKGEVKHKTGEAGENMISVFLPTTPNPTSGFLLFVPRRDMISLDMSVEEAAKLVISAGLVTPPFNEDPAAVETQVIENTDNTGADKD